MQSMVLLSNVILSIILVILILIQRSSTDSGGAFSQDSSTNYKRRGFEMIIYRATIVVAVLLFLSLTIHSFVVIN